MKIRSKTAQERIAWYEGQGNTVAVEEVSVCTPGKRCVGSPDGTTYHYEDGSTDRGATAYRLTVTPPRGHPVITTIVR